MKTNALIIGLVALITVPASASAQGNKGGGNKPDSVTGIVVTASTAGPTVTWKSIDKATYQVKRWKSTDANCCNNASASGLSATSWQDLPLPSSGTYIYRVTATTNSGQVLGDAQFSYTAPPAPAPAPAPAPIIATVVPPAAIVGTIAPAPAPAPAPITAVTTTAPIAGTALLSAGSGRYRVTMTGIQVAKPTVDDPLDRDGKADEIFANAVVVRWDRANNSRLGTAIVKSREYGDIGTSNTWPQRIRAGTALPSGGITGGNAVPIGFVPSSPSGTPGAETFPFQMWEGQLTDGGEAIVLFWSVWERDIDDVAYKNYTANWMNNRAPVLESELLKNQYSSTALMSIMGPTDAGTFAQAAAGTTFTQPNYGVFAWPALSLAAPVDRMIGMMSVYGALGYPERILVLTREKVASLTVGGYTDLQIPLIEAAVGTDGIYTVYLRVERIG